MIIHDSLYCEEKGVGLYGKYDYYLIYTEMFVRICEVVIIVYHLREDLSGP
jgi:hypothetical protein